MPEPILSVRSARGRLGGAHRLGSPEQQTAARAQLLAAMLERHICDALAANPSLPDGERERLGALLLGSE